jgi:hypothetical protein
MKRSKMGVSKYFNFLTCIGSRRGMISNAHSNQDILVEEKVDLQLLCSRNTNKQALTDATE